MHGIQTLMTTPERATPTPRTQIRRNGRLIFFGVLVLCLLFAAGYLQRSGSKATVDAEIRAMQEQLVQARQQQAILQEQLKNIEQPGAIDAAARNDLGLIQRGDQPIVVIDPPVIPTAQPVATAAPVQATDPGRPQWLRWLDCLFPTAE